MDVMEYVFLGLIIVVVLMLFILITINIKNRKYLSNDSFLLDAQKDSQTDLKIYMQKEYANLKIELLKLINESDKGTKKDLEEFKEKLLLHIDSQMKGINEKVDTRLEKGFEDTNKTFVSIAERLTKIDQAQKKIEELSNEVVSLNVIFSDKKARGTYGEVQLYQLLSSVLGNKKELYEKQKKLSNNMIVDAVYYAPSPLGMIAIDSKFPLENYKKIVDKKLSQLERDKAEKDFKIDVRKHINDIHDKYLIKGETAEQAIMFVPAEAIFAEISAYHDDLVEYAISKNVMITSPTTLIANLSIMQAMSVNIERDKQAHKIISEVDALGVEFSRYVERWERLKKNIDSVSSEATKVHTTSKKISNKFGKIHNVKFDEIETNIDLIENDMDND